MTSRCSGRLQKKNGLSRERPFLFWLASNAQVNCSIPFLRLRSFHEKADPCQYMFPRRDGIVLGGTHVRGDWSLEPDLAAKSRILAGHAKLFSAL
jgi:hypothetical protein